jgi:uncharacterized protein with NRDE domain
MFRVCLILFAYRTHPAFPLVLAANRDEFFARPTLPAAPWSESPAVFGGRDLDKGGSWLAVSAHGRMAAVTNVRDGRRGKTGTRSRGLLVNDFVSSDLRPAPFLERVHASRDAYDGFNLLLADESGLFHYANVSGNITAVEPGVHGLSNDVLDTPWPKVERGKAELASLLGGPRDLLVDGLFRLLADTQLPPDDALPRTGVSLEWERLLGTAFISTSGYGTRASTVVLVQHSAEVTFIERNFAPGGILAEVRSIELGAEGSSRLLAANPG